MDLEKFMKETPREKWPKFVQAAADRAERLGKTVQQVLDEDVEALHAVERSDDPDEYLR